MDPKDVLRKVVSRSPGPIFVEQRPTPLDFVNDAVRRNDWAWVYFHGMLPRDREAFDAYLVAIKHPLAFEAGTNESRFRAFVETEAEAIAAARAELEG